mgnify:CR=1 FL=1
MAVNIQGITDLYDGLSDAISEKLDALYTANKIDAETYSKLVTQALSSTMQLAIDTYQKQETIDISNSKLEAEIIKIDADTEMVTTQKTELIAKGFKDRELLDSQISLTGRQEYKIMSDISNQNLITDADLAIKTQQEFSEKIKNGDVAINVTYTPDYTELIAQELYSEVTNDIARLEIVSPNALHLTKQASTSDGAVNISGYYYYYYDGSMWAPIQDTSFSDYPGLKNVVQVTYSDGQSLSLYNAQINDTVSQTTARNIKVADDLISTETQREVAAEDVKLKATQATVMLKEQGNKDHLTAVEAELKAAQVGAVEADESLKLAQADGVGRDIIIKELANRKDLEVKDAQKTVAYRDAMIKEQQQLLLSEQTSYEASKTQVLNATRIDNLLIKDAEIINTAIQGYSNGGLIPPAGLLTSSSALTAKIASRAAFELASEYLPAVWDWKMTSQSPISYVDQNGVTQTTASVPIDAIVLIADKNVDTTKAEYGQRYLNTHTAVVGTSATYNFKTSTHFKLLD